MEVGAAAVLTLTLRIVAVSMMILMTMGVRMRTVGMPVTIGNYENCQQKREQECLHCKWWAVPVEIDGSSTQFGGPTEMVE